MRLPQKRPKLSELERRRIGRAINCAIGAAESFRSIASDAIDAVERLEEENKRLRVLASTEPERGAAVN